MKLIEKWQKLRKHLYKAKVKVVDQVTLSLLVLLRIRYPEQPVPFSFHCFVQRFARIGNHSISNVISKDTSSGEQLQNNILKATLKEEQFGGWALDVLTLNYIEQKIHMHKPSMILEFGSGISTVCLTQYMLDVHGDTNAVYVISVDQGTNYAASTRKLLSNIGLDQNAIVLNANLAEYEIEGRSYTCYALYPEMFTKYLDIHKAGMVFIDGPSGGGLNRFGTLAQVFDFLSPGSWFFMDDAYRQDETEVGRLWDKYLPVDIHGVVPVGKGILVGKTKTI